MAADLYSFRRATEADIPLIQRWRAAAHVARWWDDDAPSQEDLLEDLAEAPVRIWIVSLGGRPFACVQDYDPHAWPDHPFAFLPPGSRGMDQYIGEADLLGAGHGPRLIRTHVERLFGEGAPAVGVDPHPDNARAIRAYEKAGFDGDAVRETAWGLCRLMATFAEPEPARPAPTLPPGGDAC